jgi:hypothetical protein
MIDRLHNSASARAFVPLVSITEAARVEQTISTDADVDKGAEVRDVAHFAGHAAHRAGSGQAGQAPGTHPCYLRGLRGPKQGSHTEGLAL